MMLRIHDWLARNMRGGWRINWIVWDFVIRLMELWCPSVRAAAQARLVEFFEEVMYGPKRIDRD